MNTPNTSGYSLMMVLGLIASSYCNGAEPARPLPKPFAGEPAAVWAAGYAGYVQHFCHGWEMNTDALWRAGANPTPDNMSVDTDWGEKGRFSVAMRAGAAEAERAMLADANFCIHPIQSMKESNQYLENSCRRKTTPAERLLFSRHCLSRWLLRTA